MSWEFDNLTPNSALTYEVYGYSASGLSDTVLTADGSNTFTKGNDAEDTPLGPGWYDLGTVTVPSPSTSEVKLTYSTGGDPSQLCLIEQTSATAYDADGNVTATIGAIGRVAASTCDELGQDTNDYQGQVLAGDNVTFKNLAPNGQLSYNVYVPSSTDQTPGHYTIHAIVNGNNESVTWSSDPTAPSPGEGWSLLGTLTVPAATASGNSKGSGVFAIDRVGQRC